MVSDEILTLIFVQEFFFISMEFHAAKQYFLHQFFVPVNKFWKGLAGKIVKKRSFDVVHGPNYFRL